MKFALEGFCPCSFLSILQINFQKDFKFSVSSVYHPLLKDFQCFICFNNALCVFSSFAEVSEAQIELLIRKTCCWKIISNTFCYCIDIAEIYVFHSCIYLIQKIYENLAKFRWKITSSTYYYCLEIPENTCF